MQNRVRSTLLRLAELTGLYSLVYPGFMLLRHAVFGAGGVVAELIFSLCVFFAGVFAGRYIIRDKCAFAQRLLKNPLIDFIWEGNAGIRAATTIAAYSTSVVPVCVVSALYWNAGAARTIFACVFTLLFYCTCIKLSNYEPGSILSRASFYPGLILTAFYIFICTYFKSYALYGTLLFIFALIFMMMSFIVQNQSELDYVFIKKTSHSAPVPDKIRSYNLAAVLLFFAAVILLINLKGIVVSIIKALQQVIGWVASAVSDFLSMIMPYGTQHQDPAQQMQYPAFPESEAQNPIWGLITDIVQYFVLLYIIYKISPHMFSALKKAAASFSEWVKRLLKVNSQNEPQSRQDCYYDEIEPIAEDERSTLRRADKRLTINIKRDLKKIKDPVRKVRYIYYAILCTIFKKNRALSKSDTTEEIYDKIKDCKEMVHYVREATEVYDRVRYGMQIPQKNETDLLEDGLYRLFEIKKL
ncbi:hypothetical protein DFR58_10120 [Anaerobacterium chartisolvens]|uniref:DUF4129 domain-containing protein n=1 Tax=Anaerobacterium chartisolvens TaxID=1297424 RepID=A0A369BJP5_9FIRM|nr:hypothetical protein [Anaerobacterium chartisolvens]RCX20818.1 hypothetical protein DFR58_10120 [Anaerobacterium chartisolvens]